jgi:hypothetical protein
VSHEWPGPAQTLPWAVDGTSSRAIDGLGSVNLPTLELTPPPPGAGLVGSASAGAKLERTGLAGDQIPSITPMSLSAQLQPWVAHATGRVQAHA